MGEGCIFCSIVRGEAPSSRVYENEKVVAFMDAYPVNPGHLLVIPRDHYPKLADLDPELGGEVFKVAIEMAEALRRADIQCEGVNLILADVQAAGQEVHHVHLHVIPRYEDDNFSMSSITRERPTRDQLDDAARKIRTCL